MPELVAEEEEIKIGDTFILRYGNSIFTVTELDADKEIYDDDYGDECCSYCDEHVYDCGCGPTYGGRVRNRNIPGPEGHYVTYIEDYLISSQGIIKSTKEGKEGKVCLNQ